MRTASLTLFLLGLVCSSVVGQGVVKPKTPNFVICEPDRVVLYPSNVTVSTDDLKTSGNALEKLMDGVETNKTSEFVVVLVRPKSVKYYRVVRNFINERHIDVSYDVLDANEKPLQKLPPVKQLPKLKSLRGSQYVGIQATFFECRQNEVFFMDKAGLDAQVEKVVPSLGPGGDLNAFLKKLRAHEIGNDFYKVIPEYLLTAIIALEPRPGVHGDAMDQLSKPSGKFQKALSHLKPDGQYVVFLVRDDSFPAFRKARMEAEKLGFDVGWELLATDEPIKFGVTGSPINVR